MEKRKINSGLVFDFAFKGSLCEAAREPNQSSSDLCDSAGSYIRAGSAMFFAEPAPSHEQRAPLRAKPKDKSLFISFPTRKKSAFIRAALWARLRALFIKDALGGT